MDDNESPIIHTGSIVNGKNLKPLVTLKWGEQSGEFTPKEARNFALTILAAADAAESDSFLIRFMTKKMGMSIKNDAAQINEILTSFRNYREMDV